MARKKTVAKSNLPSHEILSLYAQMDIIGEDKIILPLHDLLVGVMRGFRAKRWIAYQALIHNRPQRPPIAFFSITLL